MPLGVLILVLLLSASCARSDTPSAAPPGAPSGSPNTLRALADSRGLLVGAAVDQRAFTSDTAYTALLAREFNLLVPETALNFRFIHPERDRYDFTRPDQMVDFARANGMQVMAPALTWVVNPPAWLTSRTYSRDELIAILQDHVRTVIGHYRGRFYGWVVVNEAVANPSGAGLPGLQDTVWLGIGPDYIDIAFRAAHEADPAARLFYNDYGGEGLGRKSDAIYQLLQRLLSTGVPVHGVGLQMHIDDAARSLDTTVTAADLSTNLQRLAGLGLDVRISEMDVRLDLRQGPPASAVLQQQARIYRDLVGACMRQPRCANVTFWGVTDRYSWLPTSSGGAFGAAHLFDEAMLPKPAYEAVREALSTR